MEGTLLDPLVLSFEKQFGNIEGIIREAFKGINRVLMIV